MQVTPSSPLAVVILFALACLQVGTAFALPGEKPSKSGRNISAVGHSDISMTRTVETGFILIVKEDWASNIPPRRNTPTKFSIANTLWSTSVGSPRLRRRTQMLRCLSAYDCSKAIVSIG